MKILNQKDRQSSSYAVMYEKALALGLIEGSASMTKFGRNTIAQTEVLCSEGGVYGMPVTAETVVTTSTDIADISTGVGAQLIAYLGIDENDDLVVAVEKTEIETTTKFKRVMRVKVVESGTVSPTGANANLGVLTVTQSTSLVDMIKVPINQGQTQTACMSIPKGFTGLIKYADAVVGEGKQCNVKLKVRADYNNVKSPFQNKGERDAYQNQVGRLLATPSEIPEMSDIVMTGISSASGADLSAVYVVELVENAKNGLV